MAVDRNTNYEIGDVLGTNSLGGLTDENLFGEDTLDPTNSLLLGATQRTSTAFGRTATVKAGEDIRPALESLKSAGGGTLILLAGVHKPTYDIVSDSNINIVGEGKDITIIDFLGAAYQVKIGGASSSDVINNCLLSNLTIQNSNALYGLLLQYSQNVVVTNVKVTSCDQRGLLVTATGVCRLENVEVSSCTGLGIVTGNTYLSGVADEQFYINCIATDNGDDGFTIARQRGFYIGCRAEDNTGKGFNDTGGDNIILCCNATGNGEQGYFASVVTSFIIGSRSTNNTGVDYEVTGGNLIANDFSFNQAQGPRVTLSNSSYSVTNAYASTLSKKDNLFLTNESGGTLTAGSVVVLKSTAAGDEITTTTTQGDDKVFGVNPSLHISGLYDKITTEGFLNNLRVDGTTAISVGDFLGTFTTAGIAMKAAAGDMAFAIALEAYSTADSNGVIDALLIKPRKI